MTLYEIDSQLESLIDPDTGEITDINALTNLEMERNQKIEGVVLWIKNLKSDANALKAEEEAFAKRRKVAENTMNRLKEWLVYACNGDPFETAKCKVYFRNLNKTFVDDTDKLLDWVKENDRSDLLKQVEPELSKSAIVEAIKDGEDIPYTHQEDSYSAVIK